MIVKTSFGEIKKFEFAKYSPTNEEMGRGYLIIFSRPNNSKVGLIEDIFTEEKFRRQGVFNEIMTEMIDFAMSKNCYKICLACNNDNVHLYEKFGFRKHENAMRLDL